MNAIPKQAWSPVKYEQIQFGGGTTPQGQTYPGGLDLTTPNLRLQSGALRDCLNFECAQFGGYARAGGYERVDGRQAPSSAVYTVIQLAELINTPALGDVVTQAVSGATGVVIAVVAAPVPYIVVTKVTGIFDTSHTITTPGGLDDISLDVPVLWGI